MDSFKELHRTKTTKKNVSKLRQIRLLYSIHYKMDTYSLWSDHQNIWKWLHSSLLLRQLAALFLFCFSFCFCAFGSCCKWSEKQDSNWTNRNSIGYPFLVSEKQKTSNKKKCKKKFGWFALISTYMCSNQLPHWCYTEDFFYWNCRPSHMQKMSSRRLCRDSKAQRSTRRSSCYLPCFHRSWNFASNFWLEKYNT